ncbi:MAG: hypothetical protein ABI779_28240 [Acidobacteriota bacterium]
MASKQRSASVKFAKRKAATRQTASKKGDPKTKLGPKKKRDRKVPPS